jgi:hypothetical protein
MVDGPALKFFDWIAATPLLPDEELPEPDVSDEQINALGEIVAILVSQGADEMHALEATSLHFAESQAALAWTGSDGADVIGTAREMLERHQTIARGADRLTAWMWNLRQGLVDGSAPWWAPFEFLYLLVARVVAELLKMVLLLLSFLFADIDV